MSIPENSGPGSEHIESILHRLLRECNNLQVLKTVLAISALGEHNLPVLEAELLRFSPLLEGIQSGNEKLPQDDLIRDSIDHAVEAGLLLRTENDRGQSQLHLPGIIIETGNAQVQPDIHSNESHRIRQDSRPNAFESYEQNIGLITPIIADKIAEALSRYPEQRVEEAIDEAVSYNRRNWRYIEIILENWAAEGQDRETNQRNHEEHLDAGKYLHGKYASLFRKP